MFIEVTFSREGSIYFVNKNVKFVLFYNLETNLNIKLYFQLSFHELLQTIGMRTSTD